jgi:hypothetical protein
VKKPIPFLPIFFATLTILFAGAVIYRVRAYQSGDSRMTGRTASAATSALSESTPSGRTAGMPSTEFDAAKGDAASINTATISDASGTYGVSSSRPVSSREQRFNELLRATVTSGASASASGDAASNPAVSATPPTPVPVKPQSAIARLLAPVVNALTGNSTSNAQPAPNHQHETTPTTPRDHDHDKEHVEKDMTSDTTPPQLGGLQFDPPAIHDGEETVMTVVATDDISGVRNISGSVTSPTGKALQGFALQPVGNDRYSGRILVPKDAEEGIWHINFLSLSDNASNTQNLNFGQGMMPPTGQFRVSSSRPDSAAPTVTAIRLDKPAITVNEKVTVFVTAEDDKSGVNLVSGVFQSPSKLARLGFGCRPADGATWQCEVTPPKCLDCGNWQLEQIQLQDKANNMATVRIDNPIVGAVKLNVTGESCDAAPPGLTSLVLDTPVVSNAEVSTITLTAFVSDDQCGVSSVSGQAAGPTVAGQQPPRLYFSFSPSSEGQWVGKLTIPKFSAKGTWSIVWVQALDKGSNLKTYSQSDPVLVNAKFTVR